MSVLHSDVVFDVLEKAFFDVSKCHAEKTLEYDTLLEEHLQLKDHNVLLQLQLTAKDSLVKTQMAQLQDNELKLMELEEEKLGLLGKISALQLQYNCPESEQKESRRLLKAYELELLQLEREKRIAMERQLMSLQERLAETIALQESQSQDIKRSQALLESEKKKSSELTHRLDAIMSGEMKCLMERIRSSDGREELSPRDCAYEYVTSSSILEEFSKRTANNKLMESISKLSSDGRLFELLCCEIFRRKGYRVRHCGGANDGGVDFELILANGQDVRRRFGQCKLYSSRIGTSTIRDFCGALVSLQCLDGVLITSSGFTRAAMELAETLAAEQGIFIELWDCRRINLETSSESEELIEYLDSLQGAMAVPITSSAPKTNRPEMLIELEDHMVANSNDEPLSSRSTLQFDTDETNTDENIQMNTLSSHLDVLSVDSNKIDCPTELRKRPHKMYNCDLWSSEEVAALGALVEKYREKEFNRATCPGGRNTASGEGRIAWGLISAHILNECHEAEASGRKCVFNKNHTSKEKLRSKWKNICKQHQN